MVKKCVIQGDDVEVYISHKCVNVSRPIVLCFQEENPQREGHGNIVESNHWRHFHQLRSIRVYTVSYRYLFNSYLNNSLLKHCWYIFKCHSLLKQWEYYHYSIISKANANPRQTVPEYSLLDKQSYWSDTYLFKYPDPDIYYFSFFRKTYVGDLLKTSREGDSFCGQIGKFNNLIFNFCLKKKGAL